MRALCLLLAAFNLFWAVAAFTCGLPFEDTLAWSLFHLYFFVLMVWGFFRYGKSRGSEEFAALCWPIMVPAMIVMTLVMLFQNYQFKKNHPV